jgi:uncharacterized protein YunC (DUF1805 family)
VNFNYDDYYRPCHDVVFAIMFADKSLFVKLCSAVYGQPVAIEGEPHSQAVMRENDVLLNAIRFDVLGIAAETKQIFTVDMQRRYFKGRQERRGVYYVCRAVSVKNVADMKYEELHPVHISFILTDRQSAAKGIRRAGLCYLDTGELYDDLMDLVLVYVPSIIKAADASKDSDIYVFSRFFVVSSQKDADAYADEFETNDLAKELIRMYDSIVANYQNLQTVENSPYFTQRLTEAQLAEARAEAEAKGVAKAQRLAEAQLAEARAEAEAKGIAKGIAKAQRLTEAQLAEARIEAEAKGVAQLAKLIKDGYDVDTALKMLEKERYP